MKSWRKLIPTGLVATGLLGTFGLFTGRISLGSTLSLTIGAMAITVDTSQLMDPQGQPRILLRFRDRVSADEGPAAQSSAAPLRLHT